MKTLAVLVVACVAVATLSAPPAAIAQPQIKYPIMRAGNFRMHSGVLRRGGASAVSVAMAPNGLGGNFVGEAMVIEMANVTEVVLRHGPGKLVWHETSVDLNIGSGYTVRWVSATSNEGKSLRATRFRFARLTNPIPYDKFVDTLFVKIPRDGMTQNR